jgi:AraC-like DNA-binding protein
MMYREVQPHPKLRKVIKCFWVLDHDYGNSIHDHERLWADAHTELIFTSGHRYFRKITSRRVRLPGSFVIGPFQKELELFSAGRTALVAARFWPWGFHPFSKIPMTILTNELRSCRHAVGTAGDSFGRKLAALDAPDERVVALERWLLEIVERNEEPRLLTRPLATDILQTNGRIRIRELLRKHGIAARRLERLFLNEIGVTAKIFSRIVRFNHARKEIEKSPDVDLLSLAYECGYADQAHFTRNFREMFGLTPSQFKARMKEFLRLFQEHRPDVVFLQDSPDQTS